MFKMYVEAVMMEGITYRKDSSMKFWLIL